MITIVDILVTMDTIIASMQSLSFRHGRAAIWGVALADFGMGGYIRFRVEDVGCSGSGVQEIFFWVAAIGDRIFPNEPYAPHLQLSTVCLFSRSSSSHKQEDSGNPRPKN